MTNDIKFSTKVLGMAAVLATVSTGAVMAQTSTTEKVPSSLEDSRLVEGSDVKTVESFNSEKPLAESAEDTDLAESGATTMTEVDATAGMAASLEDSRLAEAEDIMNMSGDADMYIWTMSDVDGVTPWADEDATAMRAAILDNTAVKSSLEAEGYSESDVVAAYTRADGGLTVVVE
jgi:hypothetical protein